MNFINSMFSKNSEETVSKNPEIIENLKKNSVKESNKTDILSKVRKELFFE